MVSLDNFINYLASFFTSLGTIIARPNALTAIATTKPQGKASPVTGKPTLPAPALTTMANCEGSNKSKVRSVLFFGLSSLLLIYVIVPFCFYLAKKMDRKKFLILSYTICAIVLFDEFYNLIFARMLSLPRASSIYKKLGFHYLYFK